MTRNGSYRIAAAFCALFMLLLRPPQGYADDFGKIVEHIEARYHVHQQHNLVFDLAGTVAHLGHFAGVKDIKIAFFEDERLSQTADDKKLDEIVQSSIQSGFRPLVQSHSRRSGEHTYIYAQTQAGGTDLKLLIVNLEPGEAAVVQMIVDPDKLIEVIRNPHDFGKDFWGGN